MNIITSNANSFQSMCSLASREYLTLLPLHIPGQEAQQSNFHTNHSEKNVIEFKAIYIVRIY